MLNETPSAASGQNDFNSTQTAEKAFFQISLFQNKTDNKPQIVWRSWRQLCDKFQTPQIRAGKDGLLFSGATFEPALRRKENVRELSLLVFDVDHNADFDGVKARFDLLKCAYAIHSTHSHLRQTKENPNAEPRFRVAVPLFKPIPAKDFPNLWQRVKSTTALPFDESAKDASRIFYAPAKADENAPFDCHVQNGSFLDWQTLTLDAFGANNETNAPTVSATSADNPTSSFSLHDERHAELCRRIEAQAKNTGRGGFEMKCPAHDGNGDTSLFYDLKSGAVACLKKPNPCGYFEILRAFGFNDERLPSKERAENSAQTEIETTAFEKLPEPSDKCFYGLAGDFVRTVEPHTEGDKSALLVQFLTFFGVIVGRAAHYLQEADKHFTNLFCVIVGNTATGRKGTSLGRVKQVFKDVDSHFEKNCIVGGLSSGEGLLYQIRDAAFGEKKNKDTGEMETVCTDKGVDDKRLLVIEGEFAQVLHVQGREGNTLSACLRNFWDTGTAQNLTKNFPLKTTNAHVGIIGHITKTELLACLAEVEAANGYANRFLFACGNRSKLLPFGGDVPEYEINRLRERIRKCLEFARTVDRMQFTPDAARLWVIEYQRLETSRFGYLAKITQRASPYVLRLSCIFALLDKEKFIGVNHLEAALAVWQYCEDSARYIFGNQTSDKLANKILTLLREAGAGGLTKTEIHDLTKHTYDAKRLNAALKTLFENCLAHFESVAQPTAKKPVEKWFAIEMILPKTEFAELNEFNLTDKITNSANSVNSDNEEIFTPSDGKLFDCQSEGDETKPRGEDLPSYYTFSCWTCETTVSNQDSHCPNCEQNLNQPPF